MTHHFVSCHPALANLAKMSRLTFPVICHSAIKITKPAFITENLMVSLRHISYSKNIVSSNSITKDFYATFSKFMYASECIKHFCRSRLYKNYILSSFLHKDCKGAQIDLSIVIKKNGEILFIYEKM